MPINYNDNLIDYIPLEVLAQLLFGYAAETVEQLRN
jgi:hypothetical protein